MKQLLLILVIFITSFSTTHAATWYDKLPKSGEVAPGFGVNREVQPNFSGNINSTNQSVEVPEGASPSESAVAQNSPPVVNLVSQPSLWKIILPLFVLILALAVGWFMLFRKQRGN